jgi:hypothetical protein
MLRKGQAFGGLSKGSAVPLAAFILSIFGIEGYTIRLLHTPLFAAKSCNTADESAAKSSQPKKSADMA